MKKILGALILSGVVLSANAQLVEQYGGGYVSDNKVLSKIDIEEIGRSIHTASVEDGNLVVRRFYRGKWEVFDETPIKGIFKLKALELFAYKAVPYVFCYYDDKMTVIRAINDKWEFVGEETFGEGSMENPEFSVIGETPYIVYEDQDYETLRMISLLDDSWYDVDLMGMQGVKSYRLAENQRGDLYLAILNESGITIREVDQENDDVNSWTELSKTIKLDNVNRIDDFEFVENVGYITYKNEDGELVISHLPLLEKKWEVIEESETPIDIGEQDYDLNVSEYYFYTSLSADGIPQFLKNNKKGVWGDITDLSKSKANSIASTDYRNVIYVAYVDKASEKLMVKKIEKGLNDK